MINTAQNQMWMEAGFYTYEQQTWCQRLKKKKKETVPSTGARDEGCGSARAIEKGLKKMKRPAGVYMMDSKKVIYKKKGNKRKKKETKETRNEKQRID